MTARVLSVAIAAALLAACGARAQAPAEPAIYAFSIGALNAVSLKDASFNAPNDGKMIGVDEGPEKVAAVLKAAGAPTETLSLSVQALVVTVGERVFMIDTGNGPALKGALPGSLKLAGIAPESVTDIVITHGHPDHVNGLLAADGTPAFPNAKVRMTEAEWAWLQTRPWGPPFAKGLAGRVETFQPGATLAPGVTAVEVRGHTPGHTAVLIQSGDAKLLAIGDTAHHYVVSLREPEFTIQFDGDAPTAEASRRALLERAVTENLTVFAPHFPYPGVGAVRREGDGFAWVPAE